VKSDHAILDWRISRSPPDALSYIQDPAFSTDCSALRAIFHPTHDPRGVFADAHILT
jgi:hypothetical protein